MTILQFPKRDTAADAVYTYRTTVAAYNSSDDLPQDIVVTEMVDNTQSVTGLHMPDGIYTLTYQQAVALRDALDAALAAGYPNGGRVA